MMAKTHALLSVTVMSFALETTQPVVLGLAAIASLLPDVDTSTSLAGRLCWPLSRWLERRWPHRTVTHSFLVTALLGLVALPLYWHNRQVWCALVLGYFCGWFGDAFTKSGVAAFYPLTAARFVIPANPRLRLATGARAEYVVCAFLLVSFLVSLNVNTSGGLLRRFNLWLAQPEGVVTLFARESNRYQILAHITGRLVASSEPVAAEFEVLEVEGEKLLVRAANGALYWAGHTQACPACHLDIHRVQARLGFPIVTETHEWQWQEEELRVVVGSRWSVTGKNAEPLPAPDFSSPATSHRPPTTVFFSGELTLRDADSLRVPTSLQQFNPVEVVGNAEEWARYRKVRIRAATLGDLAPLSSYFGAGHLVVRIIRRKE